MKRLSFIIGLTLLCVTAINANASRVWSGPDGDIRRWNEWATLACPSAGYTAALIVSYAVAVCIVAFIARRKGIRLATPHFIMPGLLFPVYVWLSISARITYADIACAMQVPSSEMFPWDRAFWLLGSRWYGAPAISGIWALTHPVLLLRSARTRRATILAYVPCVLVPVALLAWIFYGTSSFVFHSV